MKPRVLLGMSGGVDSSVAAALLLRQGYDVIGITMKMWPQDCLDREADKACGPFAMVDARAVAGQLGFPHYVVDEQAHFQKSVIDYFVSEYRAGRTPNPCILCNERVKFGALLEKANALGAEWIATGHYARITTSFNSRAQLLRSRESQKDQTYFLFSLKQTQLTRCLFPVGELTKKEVRALATELKLKVAEKEDSQEICFVPEHDYRRFLREDGKLTPREGEIMTRDGQVLGHHPGIEYFTIGQRKGLGISAPQPYYVIALEASTNRVMVGNPEELMTREFFIERPSWIAMEDRDWKWETGDQTEKNFKSLMASSPSSLTRLRCSVKIRSQHVGVPCTLSPTTNSRFHVKLDSPERAVTPGQAAVFYDGDLVLGGGWISFLEMNPEAQGDLAKKIGP
jgi:tRNA-specific 2-thiouridylase